MGSFIRDILGAAAFTAQGNLNRYLPAAHPLYDYLYATRISNIEGIAPEGALRADGFQRITQTHFRDVAIYTQYRMTVEFEPRPYLIETDESLKGTWQNKNWYYDFQNINNVRAFTDCKEYNRFTEVTLESNAEFLTTPTNVFFFRGGWADGNAVGATTTGSGVNILICKPTLKLTWYFVPYEMVFSPNITDALGKVNQYDFFNYKAGSLLFKGLDVNKYAPPFQVVGQGAAAGARPEHTRMCDITYIFEVFSQNSDDLDDAVKNGALGGNVNVATPPFGHNLVINGADFKYHYVSAKQNPLQPKQDYRPVYLSYPMEKLFRFDR